MSHTSPAGPVMGAADPLSSAFWHEVQSMPHGEKIKNCIQCGTCSGSCPVAYMMDITPRRMVALFRAGRVEQILKSRSLWLCASCYSCRVRCPQGILVTDLMYALKRVAKEKKIFPEQFAAHVLAATFVNYLYKYGRSYELGLGARYILQTAPTKAMKSAGFGMAMLRRGRLGVRPQSIRGIQQLRAIIDKANELEKVR